MSDLSDFSSSAIDAAARGQAQSQPNQPQQFDPNATYGTPPKLLDNLSATESSGDPHAINAKTGAMGEYQFMPSTVAMLHKQGVTFNPFDGQQSRAAADYYISKLAQQNGGDYSKAIAQYGGFKTQDPSAYVGKVMNGVNAPQLAQSAQPPTAPDPFSDFSSAAIDGAVKQGQATETDIPTTTPAPTPATPASAPNVHGPIQTSLSDLVANQVSSLGSTVAGGYAGLYQGAKTLLQGGGTDKALNDAVNAIYGTEQAGTYTPRTAQGAEMVKQFGSGYNPLNWIPNATQAVGNAGGDALASAGLPGAGAVVKGIGAAAPLALGLKSVQGGLSNLSDLVKPTAEALPEAARIDPTLDPAQARPLYKLVDGKPVLISDAPPGAPSPITPITPAGAGGAVLAPVNDRPQVEVRGTSADTAQPIPSSPEKVQAIAQAAPAKLFPDTPTIAPQGGTFSPAQQAQRAQVLQSVGIDPNNLRKSAISGDALGGSTDFQTAKLDSPAGRQMRAVLDNEKAALSDHADSLIKNTGGSNGIDQSALYARGNTILAPLDGLKQYFDNKTMDLYQAADARAQGVPTQLSQFKNVLGDASEKTNSDRVLLPDAVTSYANKLGMVGDDGSISGSVQQAETLRKYLNEKWSPQNSGFVGKLKDALDDDVTQSAGDDIYGQARALRAQRAATLDDPNGIAKLMDSSGPQEINRAVPVEKIPDQLTGMPVDQFSHVIQTLKNSPPELQSQAGAALSEIKAQFANKVQAIGSSQQGQWNARGVTKYLQNNAGRMAQVFSPEEIANFRNLNDAGHIVAKDQSYPGRRCRGKT